LVVELIVGLVVAVVTKRARDGHEYLSHQSLTPSGSSFGGLSVNCVRLTCSALPPYNSAVHNDRNQQSWHPQCGSRTGMSWSRSATAACSSSSKAFPSDSLTYTACVSVRSEEHTSELQSRENLVCRLLLEKKK